MLRLLDLIWNWHLHICLLLHFRLWLLDCLILLFEVFHEFWFFFLLALHLFLTARDVFDSVGLGIANVDRVTFFLLVLLFAIRLILLAA